MACHFEDHGSAEKQYPMFGVSDSTVNYPGNKQESNKAILMAHLKKIQEKHQKVQDEESRTKQEEAEMMKKAKQE